jgi:hypothetical protein
LYNDNHYRYSIPDRLLVARILQNVNKLFAGGFPVGFGQK